MKRALITGITGQDGSYLAELLLEKGYEVWGIIRRSSSFNTGRIDHLYRDPHEKDISLRMVYGDLNDSSSLNRILRDIRPDEIYNLGAQSHVKVSFEIPEYTGEVDALGATRILEAMRDVGLEARYYQASSSEMFGKVSEVPQTEMTPFYPRSPYACAKAYAFHITRNYREAYGLFAANGILFNHECVTAETPVIIRRRGLIDILPIEDVVPHRTDPHTGTRYTSEVDDEASVEVWDAAGWTRVTCMTATWNGGRRRAPKGVRFIAARGVVFRATDDHVVYTTEAGATVEKPASRVMRGDTLAVIPLPEATESVAMTEDEAWLLGLLAAEGSITEDGSICLTNQDENLLTVADLRWGRVTGGYVSRYVAQSGFERGGDVVQMRLAGDRAYGRYVRSSLYTRTGMKRVPSRVLNSSRDARLAFLKGFNAGDGLRSTPCTYEFQGFKTSSAVLAAGLYWLVTTTLGQRVIICPEQREGRTYYQLNLNSPAVPGRKGQHLKRPLEEVTKVKKEGYRGWLFDLATETGTFHAGIGQGWIHNSPRRGETFVTRKITRAVGRIKHGLQDRLYLGNLEAKRDWGFAPEYVEAMWRILQADEAEDYVIATGESHTVEEFCSEAFRVAGLHLEWSGMGVERRGRDGSGRVLVVVDPRYFRPAEVDLLIGDASKAKAKLGWAPKVTFSELVRIMVEADLELAAAEKWAGERR